MNRLRAALVTPVAVTKDGGSIEAITGATNQTLEVPEVTKDMSGTRYRVVVRNVLGTVNASAVLKVERRPLLVFTEVMAYPLHGDSSGHNNWFELTNFLLMFITRSVYYSL